MVFCLDEAIISFKEYPKRVKKPLKCTTYGLGMLCALGWFSLGNLCQALNISVPNKNIGLNILRHCKDLSVEW